jgi:murein DD-endopeptidase MepM/ murein hydrolase activator NlpD
MTEGLVALQARLGALDRQIRTVDPAWAGVDPNAATVTGSIGAPAAASFGAVMDAATAAPAADGSPTTSPVAPGAALPAGWSAALTVVGAASSARAGSTSAAVDTAMRVVRPVAGARISQDFGPKSFTGEPSATVDGIYHAHYHDGVDYAAPLGRSVHAIAAGRVVAAGRAADGAVIVRIRHADGSEALYAHLNAALDVRVGDRVSAGEPIGVIGLTGHTTGPHLHLELTRHGRKVDVETTLVAGRLPGADTATIDRSVLPAARASATAPSTATADALTRFDRVADRIPFAAEIRAAAVHAGIDPLLLASLVRAESGFRADAVSRVGAQGLAQLMPATSRSMGVKDPFDAATNVAAGARYIANNLRIYGRVDLALAAYQAGKGAVARAGGIPDSPTTHHYVDRILGYWSGYLEDAA